MSRIRIIFGIISTLVSAFYMHKYQNEILAQFEDADAEASYNDMKYDETPVDNRE